MPQETTDPWVGFTIDGPTSRDLDDAVLVERLEPGWRVTVYVSDVAAAVPVGHKHDVGWEAPPRQSASTDGKERALAAATRVLQYAQGVGAEGLVHVRGAREKVETKYHSEGSVPMLPRYLSEDSLSLLEGRNRKVLRVVVTLDEALDPTGTCDVSFGDFKSLKRLSYPDVPGILSDKGHESHALVAPAAQLAERLMEKRRQSGAFVLYDLNKGWVVDEDGFLKKLDQDQSTFGYVIVQELMILSNQEVARWCAHNDVPVLYRTHMAKAHAPERSEMMGEIAAAVGQSYGVVEALRQRVHLVMFRAKYEPVLRGHYGLNLPCYTHVTSPIRRYADLVNHRQVRAKVLGEPFPHSREDLDTISGEINAFKDAQKEATHLHLKDRAMTDARRHAEAGRSLERLSSGDFDNVVRSLTRVGDGRVPDGFEKHLNDRLCAGSLSIQAMELVLFEAPWPAWDGMREQVVRHLSFNPHVATSLAHVAAQAGQMSPVMFKDERTGPDHGPVFTSKAKATRGDETFRGQAVRGRTAKVAQQRATVNLLAAMVGLPTPEWHEGAVPESAPAVKAAPPKPVAPSVSENPVGSLQEWLQALGPDAPTLDYTFGQEGPPHVPTFTCTCTVGGVSVTARGPNKKDVKRQAAALAVVALQIS